MAIMVSLTLRIPHVWVNSPPTITEKKRKRKERRGKVSLDAVERRKIYLRKMDEVETRRS